MADIPATLAKTIEALSKRYGKPVITRGDETPLCRKIPTGVPAYDYVSNGGILVNQNNELYGAFSSLKSLICYISIGKFQKYDWANNVPEAIKSITYKVHKTRSKDESITGLTFAEIEKITPARGYKPVKPIVAKRCALVDMEGTYDKKWGEHLGIDNEGLLYYCADSMNQAIDVIEALLRDPDICLVVLDSMSIIGSDQENENSMEDNQMATNARLWNKAARKLRSALNHNRDASLISINATSTSMTAYGDPETLKNGKQWALMKSCSVRLNGLKEIKGKLDGATETTLGRNISLMNKKQKFGEPYRTAEMYFSFVDDGTLKAGTTDVVGQLCELGMKLGIVIRSGTTYSFDTFKAVGLESFKNKLREDAEACKKLSELVYAKF